MFYRVISRNIDTPVQNPVEPQVQIGEIVPSPLPPLRFSQVVSKKNTVIHLMMALPQKLADLN